MSAIYKKELKSYLTSMIGYVYMAFILLVVGIYFVIYNINHGYPELGFTLSSVTFVFLIVTPILTMRILAEEKKQKTDQILLTSPVSVPGIVMGKYLALLTIFLIPIVIICTYPIVLGTFGTINYGVSYAALLGYFLLGAATLAIGLFISSLTESQVISAVLSFALLFFTFVVSGLESYLPSDALQTTVVYGAFVLAVAFVVYQTTKSVKLGIIIGAAGLGVLAACYYSLGNKMAGTLQELMTVFELTTHFESFVNGMIDLRGVVYYLSVIALFLFFTDRSIQKRRWS